MSLNQAETIPGDVRITDSESRSGNLLADILVIVRSEAFIFGALILAVLYLCFKPLFDKFPEEWFGPETYYNHGPLVPVMAAYMIYDRWPKLKSIEVKPFYPAVLPLGLLLYANYVALSSPRQQALSVMIVVAISLGTLFVAGWKWTIALLAPTFFLLRGLPIWETVIDVYTQPMQNISTNLAFNMLHGLGFEALRLDDTNIMMSHFSMYIGVPCSGLRMILAMIALVAFCVFIGKMRWWANSILVVLAIPICIFVNSFRIALIGIVGEMYGSDAGQKFHDTSGYISILLLVLILWRLTKALGIK